MTWNVAGLDERYLDERTEAACLALLLRPDPPEAIALQELVSRSWHAHWKHHLRHAGYTVVPADPLAATDSEYFCALALRADVPLAASGVERFAGSQMGRALVWAEVGGWWLGTSHLESGPVPIAGGARRAQLAAVIERLCAAPGPAAFAGDTNLRWDEADAVPGSEQVVDAWVAAGSDPSTRVTWVGGRGAGRGARFDRVLHNRAALTEAVWTSEPPVAAGAPASDHLALWVRLGRAG